MDSTPTADKIDRAAESAWLRLVARGMMVFGIPAILTLGGFAAAEVWSSTKKTGEVVIRLEENIRHLVTNQIPDLNKRLDGVDRRNEQQDSKIEGLQQQFWRLPGAKP